LLEGGTRTATVWTTTPVCVVVIPPDTVSESALELALGGRREQQG
jgi:CRP-like cAMP-binding protein